MRSLHNVKTSGHAISRVSVLLLIAGMAASMIELARRWTSYLRSEK